jgi:hypothetical protein
VVVEYRWRPLRGKRLRLVRRTGHRGRDSVHVETRSGASTELPAWMCSTSACASMTLGPPLVRVGALNELRAVLTAMSALRAASPTAATSTTRCASSTCPASTSSNSIWIAIRGSGCRQSAGRSRLARRGAARLVLAIGFPSGPHGRRFQLSAFTLAPLAVNDSTRATRLRRPFAARARPSIGRATGPDAKFLLQDVAQRVTDTPGSQTC